MTQRDPLQRELILGTISGALAQIPKKIKAYMGRFKTAYMSSGITTYFDNYVKRATRVTAAVFPNHPNHNPADNHSRPKMGFHP